MNKNTKMKNGLYQAICRGIPIAPTKVNTLASKIRGKTYSEALQILKLVEYHKLGSVILNTLISAASNAWNKEGVEKADLFISKAFSNQGTILKRVQPRARGKAYSIQKKMSHLTIELAKKEDE